MRYKEFTTYCIGTIIFPLIVTLIIVFIIKKIINKQIIEDSLAKASE